MPGAVVGTRRPQGGADGARVRRGPVPAQAPAPKTEKGKRAMAGAQQSGEVVTSVVTDSESQIHKQLKLEELESGGRRSLGSCGGNGEVNLKGLLQNFKTWSAEGGTEFVTLPPFGEQPPEAAGPASLRPGSQQLGTALFVCFSQSSPASAVGEKKDLAALSSLEEACPPQVSCCPQPAVQSSLGGKDGGRLMRARSLRGRAVEPFAVMQGARSLSGHLLRVTRTGGRALEAGALQVLSVSQPQ
ncbi:hypothetical protein H920_13690 [Fukomys damarensis]|uniref:Uncharacterized protein n=1 Tax=Fukomys damarensis TaxID=885580 RepID=A0A091D302_FUKDA|nr:hypothetical protein H920_13690 [Fukomys damarensis]